MLLERKDGTVKKNNGRVVIGYDLSDDHAQISYYFLRRDSQKEEGASLQGDVETLAVVTGTEQYNIPAVLCRKKEVKQWLFGI